MALPVPALLERWVVHQLQRSKAFALAESVESGSGLASAGMADSAVVATLVRPELFHAVKEGLGGGGCRHVCDRRFMV
jgi:hypothetical protein